MNWYWTAWLIFLVVSFAAGEAFALKTDRTTLSRYVWTASKRFPLLPFIVGAIVGILAAHFWWGGALICFDPVRSALAADLTLPDPDLTPGVTRKLSLKKICSTRWGTDRRFVTAAMKRQVFANYGLSGNDDLACVPDKSGRRCEIDHAYPRSLGGKDAVENLWTQPYGTHPWNAARKDRLETALSRDVCAGKTTLKHARELIMPDYRPEYIRRWGEPE